jgi:cytochrome c oxidase accessory protein FixG
VSHTPDSLRAPTVDQSGRRRWLYPDRRSGRLSRIRGRLALLLLVIYLVAPFVTIGGMPLIRFDVLQGIIYVLGQSFRFADGSYLVFVFITLFLLLAFVTSLWGRIWCGYACPQTVFVEWVIRPIEEWVEGPAHRRKRQDAGPMTLGLFARKALKYVLFSFVIWLISNAFLAYFIEPATLWHWMRGSPAEHPWAFSFMTLTFAALFLDLTWFREQFCAFVCPYARLQSVMISSATPTIAYDLARGEPRGKRKGTGDCIDCQLCVRVCPTGIDIRHGLQLECIQCGRCADACDGIMSNLGRPKGLVRMASERELSGKRLHRFRVRPIIYLALLLLNVGVVSYAVGTRDDLKLTVVRQPSTTYTQMRENEYANFFMLRVVNQSRDEKTLSLSVDPGVKLICSVCDRPIAANQEVQGNLVVLFPKGYNKTSIPIKREGVDQGLELPLLKPQ